MNEINKMNKKKIYYHSCVIHFKCSFEYKTLKMKIGIIL